MLNSRLDNQTMAVLTPALSWVAAEAAGGGSPWGLQGGRA